MQIETNKDKGNAGLALAIAYFGTNGYTVSTPLNDTQWYDLIVEKNGVFQTVQCKFTASKDNSISLRSTGGTAGTVYDNVRNHPLDLLFCVDKDINMFVIPMQDLLEADNVNSIRLRTEPNSNNQGFSTYKYLVQF